MKLHVAGVVGIMVAALSTVGCGLGGGQAKAPVSTTTLTNAPMLPDSPLPAALWEEEEELAAPPIRTWGVGAPTPEELLTYGF